MSLLFIRINNLLKKNPYFSKGLVKNYLIFLALLLLAFFSLNYILSVSANNSNGIIKIYPSADSWVESYPPNKDDNNYGSDTILHVRNMTDNTKRQTFLRFNLSEMPPGTIISATLNLYSMSSSDSRLVFLGVYLVDNDSWVEGNGSSSGCYANDTGTCGAPLGEYAITWNNKPVIGQLLNVTTVGKNKWASWNVTNAVITEYSNDKTITLALTFSAKHPYHRKDFYSSEYPNGNYTPFLNILYIPVPVTTTTTSTTTTSTTTTSTTPTTTTSTTTTTTIETTTTTTEPSTTTTIPETTTTIEPTTTTTIETTTTTIEPTTTTSTTTTTINTPPTVLLGYVNYTGSTNSGESITFWCNVTDPDQDASTLNVRLWIGTCDPSDCFTTRDWSDPPGLNNRQMTWDSGSGMFKYDWTIPWSAGTTVAGTCYAIDDQDAGSNWGDKYPFFTVTPPTIPIVENSTTQNITFCNNVMITVQAWDPDGIDTVILNDTNVSYVMQHASGNNYSVTFHPDPGLHNIRFIVNDTHGDVNDTFTDSFYVYSAPSIVSVNITPANPKTNDVLNCTPYGWYDADGDLPKYYYQWYDDSLPIANATNSTYSCSNSGCDKGDVIYCVVIPYDLYQNGTSVNGSVVIGNLPPSTPNLSPSTGTFHGMVYINCSGSVDPDGDIITYQIQTDVNGTWKDIAVNDSDGYYAWDISKYPCKSNVDLRCRAFDGIANSSWKNPTGKINIDNCGPTVILVNPTPADGVRVLNNWVFVNSIVVDNQSNVDTCILEWNGTNETMGKSTYDIIVDDGDSGYTDTGWYYATGQGYGNDVHYTTGDNSGDYAAWIPTFPVPGSYEVYVSWTTHPNRATNANYTVYYSGGSYSFTVNQENYANGSVGGSSGEWSGWYYLGKYNFTSGNVTLNDNANEYVIADAVNFTIETCGLNKTTVDCGNYTYKVYANDTLGNEGSSGYRNNKENKPPSIPVLSSPANATFMNKIAMFDWVNSTDEENDPINYDLLVDDDLNFTSPLIVKTGLTDSNYTLNGTEKAFFVEGTYYWKVRAFDTYEYSSYSSSWMFSMDVTPPRVENSSIPNVELGENVVVRVNVWDENGVDKVILRSLLGNYTMNKTVNNNYTFVILNPPLGNYTVSYFANDTVGNVNDTTVDSFNVTIPPPAKVTLVTISPSIIFNNSIYVGIGNIRFNVTFDKNMNISVPLSVTYGNVTPYNNFVVIGNWTSSKTWSGVSKINDSIPNENYTLNISGKDLIGNFVQNTSTWFIVDTNIPRVISVILSPSVVTNNITCIKEGNITFTIIFGPDMNTSINPLVTFGRSYPYDTYVINGLWFNNTIWVGYFNITSSMSNVWYTLSISGAKDLIGRTMAPDASHGFNVDTKPPMISDIYTANITYGENETISVKVKDYDCVGYKPCGLDTVLVELNNSVNLTNYTMNLGYVISASIGSKDYVYYLIINNTQLGNGTQYLKFYVNDTAGNVNSNTTASFYVNNTIPGIGGKIAFLCWEDTCDDGIENELIDWLNSTGWNVTGKRWNGWTLAELNNSDLLVCSDENYACNYASKYSYAPYKAHKSNQKPFVEIGDYKSLRASNNFGYIIGIGGYTQLSDSIYVTVSDEITTGYFGLIKIFNSDRIMTVTTDDSLRGEVKDVADAGGEDQRTTLFKKDQTGNQGRFVYLGWFNGYFDDLNELGNKTLTRAISWAQCGNAKGCN